MPSWRHPSPSNMGRFRMSGSVNSYGYLWPTFLNPFADLCVIVMLVVSMSFCNSYFCMPVSMQMSYWTALLSAGVVFSSAGKCAIISVLSFPNGAWFKAQFSNILATLSWTLVSHQQCWVRGQYSYEEFDSVKTNISCAGSELIKYSAIARKPKAYLVLNFFFVGLFTQKAKTWQRKHLHSLPFIRW